MSEEKLDPSGNTAAFQAFAHNAEPAAEKKAPIALIAGGVLAVVIVAVVVWLLVR